MKKIFLLAIAILAISLKKSYAQPAAGVYLFCNTITNNGSITIGHTDEVETLTKDEGASLQLTIVGGGINPSPPLIADFVITKSFDISSMRFRNRLLRSQALPNNLEIRYYNGTSNTPVYVITLQNCFVTSITNTNEKCTGGCPGISETISFTAAIITWRNNIPPTPQIITYDRLRNTVTSSGL
jgi:type VI protein secretion system component Hcp